MYAKPSVIIHYSNEKAKEVENILGENFHMEVMDDDHIWFHIEGVSFNIKIPRPHNRKFKPAGKMVITQG